MLKRLRRYYHNRKRTDLEKAEESKRSKIKRIIRTTANHKLMISFLTGLALVITGMGAYVYKGIQTQINSYYELTDKTMNNIDEITVICNTTKAETPLMAYFQADKIYDIQKDLRNNITNLVNQRDELGRHISFQDYTDSTHLVCWSNALLQSGMHLCEMKNLMKSPDSMDTWRRKLISEIEKDRVHHQLFTTIMTDYYYFLGSFFSRRMGTFEDAYPTPPKCDIDKISKYIDSLN